jgi:hypothetical protein
MTKKAKKKTAAKKKPTKKIDRIEKLEVVVSELAIRVKELEAQIAALPKPYFNPIPPPVKTWPCDPIKDYGPWWNSVSWTVDYASALLNKKQDKNCGKDQPPGDTV